MAAGLSVPTRSTPRLILEPLGPSHSAGMFAMWSRPEVCRYSGPAHDFEELPIRLPAEAGDDSDRIIDFFVRGAAEGTRFRWAAVTRAESVFVGAVGFNSLGACSEIAFHLRPEFWGQGFMAEAAGSALDWLRDRPGAELVEAFIEAGNSASRRLAGRLGLRSTGEVTGGADRYLLSLTA